jgi:proteasome lid subunit RPN8/RPN11
MNLDTLLQNTRLDISPAAQAKCHYMAERVQELAHDSLEIFAVALGDVEEKDDTVQIQIDDIFIPTRQSIRHASFSYDHASIRKQARRMGLDSRMLGWVHSHADFDIFHSGIDHANLNTWLDYADYSFKDKGSGDRYVLVPSLVFNAKGEMPEARLYAKRSSREQISEEKSWISLPCRDGDTIQFSNRQRRSIDSQISSVLEWNGMSVQPESFLQHILASQTYEQKIIEARSYVRRTLPATLQNSWDTIFYLLGGGKEERRRHCWRWEDRLARIQDIYTSSIQDDNMSQICLAILESHTYLVQRHPGILDEFRSIFSCKPPHYATDSATSYALVG